MGRIVSGSRYRRGGAAALVAALILVCPSLGLAGGPASGSGSAPAATRGADTKATGADPVEARITELHTKLKITSGQEEQWSKVADVMRDNADRMFDVSRQRAEKADTMTAVEDLKAYGEITDVHAAGIKRFVATFEPLYNGMSDAQKQSADRLFMHRIDRHTRSGPKAAPSASPKTN